MYRKIRSPRFLCIKLRIEGRIAAWKHYLPVNRDQNKKWYKYEAPWLDGGRERKRVAVEPQLLRSLEYAAGRNKHSAIDYLGQMYIKADVALSVFLDRDVCLMSQ